MSENNKKTHTVSKEELDRQKQFTQKVSSVISASYNEKPKACVVTYGCQQNVADSEKIKGMLDVRRGIQLYGWLSVKGNNR